MSVFAASRAVARRAVAPGSGALRAGRRCLGDSVAGPPITDLAANTKLACDFFTKDAVSYAQFKVQCVALRIFAFAGVTGGCMLSLMMDPPKSSYWQRWSPTFLLSHLKAMFWTSPQPVFLASKVEYETNVPDIYVQLTQNRRLDNAGSDSEDDH
ncbi:unnamed protein product [Prorocentrum cordatum]|uniref:Uncharacterized protein n=1 Tax=Prorocentrum cordatum TaxID=2364126 RepID=A0ABN9QPI8_9DINO|nr:unnamed protein product [Polarella glacialis]